MTWYLWRCRSCSTVRAFFTDEMPKSACPTCMYDGEPSAYQPVDPEELEEPTIPVLRNAGGGR